MQPNPPAIHRDGPLTNVAHDFAGFYRQKGKRVVDFVAAVLVLTLISPLILLMSLIVKLTSAGPVFYTQDRVGQKGRVFKIIKFRSMVRGAEQKGPGITCSGDTRITAVGRVMRKLKLDELPQLWNVIKGDMSLVGPRPELPLYVATYDQRQRQVLTARPGITDSASIAYRWEEELLSRNAIPEKFYQEVVLPSKLELNLSYIAQMSFAYDCYLIWRTLLSILSPRSTTSFITDKKHTV